MQRLILTPARRVYHALHPRLNARPQVGSKVYCSREKAATLAACGLAPDYAALLTTNHLETNFHAVCGGAKGEGWVFAVEANAFQAL